MIELFWVRLILTFILSIMATLLSLYSLKQLQTAVIDKPRSKLGLRLGFFFLTWGSFSLAVNTLERDALTWSGIIALIGMNLILIASNSVHEKVAEWINQKRTA